MVWEVVAFILIGVLETVTEVLPDADELGIDAIGGLFPYYSTLNAGLPMAEMLSGLALYAGVAGAVFGFGVIRTAWSMLPFKFS